MKVAINRCWGGFGVSKKVYDILELKWDGYGYLDNNDFGIKSDNYNAFRSDKRLIDAIEKAGENASGNLACVVIKEIPDGIDFQIDDYDGIETIHESHRSW